MHQVHSLCRPCRLHLLSWPCTHLLTSRVPCVLRPHSTLTQRHTKSSPNRSFPTGIKQQTRSLATNDSTADPGATPDLDSLEAILEDDSLTQEEKHALVRSTVGPETVARHARRRFGDRLPEGALNQDEFKIYRRLFGTPLVWKPEHEEGADEVDTAETLLRETDDGHLQEVNYRDAEELSDEDFEVEVDADDPNLEALDPSLRDDIKAALRAQPEPDDDPDHSKGYTPMPIGDVVQQGVTNYGLRTHPFTLVNRGGTDPLTLSLPREVLVEPIVEMLSAIPNRHLKDTSEKLFGGPGLPYSTGTPRTSRTMPQKPIPLAVSQAKMSPIEADVFAAILMPGMYASVMNSIVQSRRSLGTQWLRKLLTKEGGPSILDAGAGGAGVIAWREVLKAEWASLQEQSETGEDLGPAPLGKATVLTSSPALRHRASTLLENTSFLPRLPDYVHVEPRTPGEPGMPHGRKQYDIIVAPHTLWSIHETWQRRQHIQNLWAMLNENGGVLILLEKGVPRGFEVVADARQYLLDSLFVNDGETATSGNYAAEPDASEEEPRPDGQPNHIRGPHRHATAGSIVAPCTTHSKCPMYRAKGVSRQRKDYCRFSQRYYRPSYQQTILGAKARNHEDAVFSYVSVVRGVKPDELGRVTLPEAGGAERARLQGKTANDRAFAGYEIGDADLMLAGGQELEAAVSASISNRGDEEGLTATRDDPEPSVLTTPLPATPAPHPLTLPRLVLPPLKRPRHVLMDVCTPAGTLERWSVTKPFNRQAFRDARKSAWGDLWALGAKSREGRRVRVGKGILVDGREPQDIDEAKAAFEDGAVGPDAVSRANEASKPRRKLTGREKARTRKRGEKQAMKALQEERQRRKTRGVEEDDEDEEEE